MSATNDQNEMKDLGGGHSARIGSEKAEVFDENMDAVLTVGGVWTPYQLRQVLFIQNRAFQDGQRAGREEIKREFRKLLGAAELADD